MSTILLIDDESSELTALQDALGDERFDFACAASWVEARKILKSSPDDIDAVLLDWEMPDADGIEILDWIREQQALVDVEVVIESNAIEPEGSARASTGVLTTT